MLSATSCNHIFQDPLLQITAQNQLDIVFIDLMLSNSLGPKSDHIKWLTLYYYSDKIIRDHTK